MADTPETPGGTKRSAKPSTTSPSKKPSTGAREPGAAVKKPASSPKPDAKPTKASLARAAANPATPRETLADLAYDHPELRAAIAKNPSTYQGLLDWLGELDDPDVDAALAARSVEKAVPADTLVRASGKKENPKSTAEKASGTVDGTQLATAAIAPEAPVSADAVPLSEAEPASRPEYCESCGSPLRSTANYCGECGAFIPGGVPFVGQERPARRNPALLYGGIAAIVLVGLVIAIAAATAASQQGSNTSSEVGSADSTGTNYGALPQNGSVPPCPAGSAVVMWSEWDGGATVVCNFGDGSSYSMIVWSESGAQQTSDVTATPTGYSSPLAQIALGGWVVWNSDSDQSVASTAWGTDETNAAADVVGPASDISSCPAGSYPISLSLWNNGWLLTCGVSADEMSSFTYEDGGQLSSGGALQSSGDGYCGTTTDGVQVCLSSSPALVQVGTGADTVQDPVSSNYFAGAGIGGVGQGQGAYNVDSPSDTAQSEVTYLVSILEKSAAARSRVKSVLQPLNACSVTDSDVQSLQDLTETRSDLLNALDSTPVDQVPDGANILAQLKDALSLSEQADEDYVEAGQTMATGDCANGRAEYRTALAVANRAESAKQAFIESWNSEISTQFAVRTFSATDI